MITQCPHENIMVNFFQTGEADIEQEVCLDCEMIISEQHINR